VILLVLKAMAQNQQNDRQIQIISRVASLPIIHSALGFATDTYGRVKGLNGLVGATLNRAEQSIQFVAATAKPVIAQFERPISIADNIACQGLNKLEEKVPAIKKSPEEIKGETIKLYEGSVSRINGIKKYGNEKVQEIKNFGFSKVNIVLDTPYVKALLKSVDTAIELTESTVDHFLPPSANEPPVDQQTKNSQTIVVRMGHLSDKMRRRMYDQILTKWLPFVFVTVNNVKSSLLVWVNGNHSNEHSHQQ